MEGPHRQLRARLADRLGGDDADRLPDIDRGSAREITSVALAANALLRRAHERGADLHALKADLLDLGDHRLVEKRSFGNDDVAALRVDDVLCGRAAEYTVGE